MTVVGDVAYKVGTSPATGRAVKEQGEWLMRNPHEYFPRVYGVSDSGYIMERLDPIPTTIVDWVELSWVIGIIIGDLDGVDPMTAAAWGKHQLYVEALTQRFGYRSLMLEWLDDVREYDLEEAVTHGDPTFSNVMLRDGVPVLVDPIPPRPELPLLRASDHGKVLQSVYGYEAERFGWPRVEHPGLCTDRLLGPTATNEDRDAALYFALFHVLRAMKYCGKDAVFNVADRVVEAAGR